MAHNGINIIFLCLHSPKPYTFSSVGLHKAPGAYIAIGDEMAALSHPELLWPVIALPFLNERGFLDDFLLQFAGILGSVDHHRSKKDHQLNLLH